MEINKKAIAGSLESSDVLVSVEPHNSGIVIDIESSVFEQYGEDIHNTAENVLEALGVKEVYLSINDQGALDCTIKARIQTAILRANGQMDNIDWGGAIS